MTYLLVPSDRAKEAFQKQIEEGKRLLDLIQEEERQAEDNPFSSYRTPVRLYLPKSLEDLIQDEEKWSSINKFLIKSVIPDSKEELSIYSVVMAIISDPNILLHRLKETISGKIKHLQSIIEKIDITSDLDVPTIISTKSESRNSSDIFIVHGTDEKNKRHELANYLRDLGLNPIILENEAHIGRTLIEKVETNTLKIGYAFILLTPDDQIFYKKGEEIVKEPHYRPRQNAIFEFGYLLGKIGRNKTCILYEPSAEIDNFSDIQGVGYISLSVDWKSKLSKELKEAKIIV
ncbi:MAG: nucleotide-binding protein [Candidatus Micrarchaeota archaeon]